MLKYHLGRAMRKGVFVLAQYAEIQIHPVTAENLIRTFALLDAQADLGLLCLHMRVGTFAHDAAHFLFLFAKIIFSACTVIPQWFELTITRTKVHGLKDVRATEVRLYIIFEYNANFIFSFVCGRTHRDHVYDFLCFGFRSPFITKTCLFRHKEDFTSKNTQIFR